MGNPTEIVLTFKSGTLSKCCHIVFLPRFCDLVIYWGLYGERDG